MSKPIFARSLLTIHRSTLSVIHVIKHKPDKAGSHHQRVPLHQAPLEQSRGIAQHPRENCRTVHTDSVDDPLVPPTGQSSDHAREPTARVYQAIDDVRIKAGTSIA